MFFPNCVISNAKYMSAKTVFLTSYKHHINKVKKKHIIQF